MSDERRQRRDQIMGTVPLGGRRMKPRDLNAAHHDCTQTQQDLNWITQHLTDAHTLAYTAPDTPNDNPHVQHNNTTDIADLIERRTQHMWRNIIDDLREMHIRSARARTTLERMFKAPDSTQDAGSDRHHLPHRKANETIRATLRRHARGERGPTPLEPGGLLDRRM